MLILICICLYPLFNCLQYYTICFPLNLLRPFFTNLFFTKKLNSINHSKKSKF